MLPVAVVIPHLESRSEFFKNYCLPSIQANDPACVIVESGPENACRKRNMGAAKAGDVEFLFFCDDDVILSKDCLARLMEKLNQAPDKGYAYCDFMRIFPASSDNPKGSALIHRAVEFDAKALRHDNFISTMSLMRRRVFCGFDETVVKLQDWRLWLKMLDLGVTGIYVPGVLFHAYFWKPSITLGGFSV